MLIHLLRLFLAKKIRVYVALVLIAAASFFAYTQLINNSPATNADPIVDPKKDYRILSPSQSTHQNIIELLGEPQSAYEQDGMTVYMYPSSTSYYAPDQLYVKNDVLQLIELYYTPEQFTYSLQRLTSQYGKPEKILYQSYNPYMSNYVYVYPNQGVAAYLTKDDKVFKVQHFASTDLQAYRLLWGKDLYDSKPIEPDIDDQHIHQ